MTSPTAPGSNPIRQAHFISLAFLALALLYGGLTGGIALALSYMVRSLMTGVSEVSLSFDNAAINAKRLETMSPFFRKMFLWVGMPIAVLGMRFALPILIVKFSSGLGIFQTFDLALHSPTQYAEALHDARFQINAFGGSFLLLVFMNYFLNPEKDEHWIPFERALVHAGSIENLQILLALCFSAFFGLINPGHFSTIMLSSVAGIGLYLTVQAIGQIFEDDDSAQPSAGSGWASLLYLEVIDATMSFDGVISAFAITTNIFIIAIGLGIGATYIRAFTLYLVNTGDLSKWRFLEPGAMWAIGILGFVSYIEIGTELPSILVGASATGTIIAALYCSHLANQKDKANGVTDNATDGAPTI